MVNEPNPSVLASLSYVVKRAKSAGPSFGRRWAVPILFGGAAGIVSVFFATEALTNRLGDVPGGALSALAGIGLGVAVSVLAIFRCRPRGRKPFAAAADGDGIPGLPRL